MSFQSENNQLLIKRSPKSYLKTIFLHLGSGQWSARHEEGSQKPIRWSREPIVCRSKVTGGVKGAVMCTKMVTKSPIVDLKYLRSHWKYSRFYLKHLRGCLKLLKGHGKHWRGHWMHLSGLEKQFTGSFKHPRFLWVQLRNHCPIIIVTTSKVMLLQKTCSN